MRTYHIISVKRMGWEQMYDYFPFPADKYSKEDAIAQFKPVQEETMKNNGNWYPYTAYEFDGDTYYSFEYDGIFDESNLLSRGFTKEELRQL